MKTLLLAVASLGEAATGLILLVYPPTVVRLLFGAEIAGAGIVMSRIAGIALVALGIACWPGWTALCGMLAYNALATAFFAYLGIRGHWVGLLLWPAAAGHAGLTILLARAWLMRPKTGGPNNHAGD